MRSLILLTLTLSLSLSSCTGGNRTSSQNGAFTVVTESVRDHAFKSSIELSGTLQPTHTVTVGANAAGRVTALPVRVGDRVGAGSLVAQIDAAAYRAAIEQAQGAVRAATANEAVATAQLHAASIRVALDRATAARMSSLYGTGDISRQQQDETQAALQSARAAAEQAQAAVVAARGTIAQSQGNLVAAQVPLANTTVVAPFSGVVTAKLADIGSVVVPGSPIATIQTDRDLEVDLSVPEEIAAVLVPGQSVQVRIDALASRSAGGKIRAIVPSGTSDLHSTTVKIAVQASAGMIPGMFARVALPGSARTGTAVPSAALVNRGGQDGVFIIRDKRAQFVPVETGAVAQGQIEVRGLPRDAAVAISNVPQLTDGAVVTTQSP